MYINKMSKFHQLVFTICMILLLVACSGDASTSTASFPDSYPIDDVFVDFYNRLGGVKFLGPGISPAFSREGIFYQYTVAALLVYDVNAPTAQQYRLASIAREWDIEEPSEPEPVKQDVPYINGHMIWEEILPYYIEHGSALLGEPLTGVKFNPTRNRYEQYLMNVGFYRGVDEPLGAVHLLPYGAWMCAQACDYEIQDAVPDRLTVIPSNEALRQADEVFLEIAGRLGFDFTGEPLSEAGIANDGKFEKIFENIVLFSDPQVPTQVTLRPLPLLLGIEPDPPVPASKEIPRIYFYPTQGDLGYNVPEPFVYYVTGHGTMEVSGVPITELHQLDESVMRQCFTNLCLEYHSNAPAALQIRPSSLGIEYQQVSEQPSPETPTPKPSGMVSVQVIERSPILPADQSQIIESIIYEDQTPLNDVEFMVILTLPDGSQTTIYMPPTDRNGKSSVILDPINAPNGTVIPYQACVLGIFNPPVCILESFVIWQSP